MTIAKAITSKTKLHQKPWFLKRVQDDIVQKVTDSERSEHASFAQGEMSHFDHC
ncbi:hypothetical protein [Pseudoalteromonas sp. Of7M-16]|uniref:hypothetical protein n=1 Tax=Pseudoalteromonas sp. Of7M-16 TaxID=2917756 RepID=UPI001EF6E76D|nr:hypothetical protein [Pseudoalteromonas sp. Of7M-16]MCG7549373.1 hypothetical protein [Pseudoalteromonas sp. Of7M-16]